MKLKFFLLTQFLFLSACTSWMVRQDCEGRDWFKHGYSVAMEGRRLTGDPTVKKCKDAEYEVPYGQVDAGFKEGMAKYCLPTSVFATGKSGDLFNPELCDPAQVRALNEQYQLGKDAYCAVENGYNVGLSGKQYQNICNTKSESAFLKEYRRGRKAFVVGKINESDSTLLGAERMSLDLERQRNQVSWRLQNLPRLNPGQNAANDPFHRERENLNSELRSLDSQINQKMNEKDSLLKKKGEYQAELATLQD
jgi:hypothetical protein